VTRKKKEARQAERKHLTGNEARELYLECLQLLLRKQVAWLVRQKGLHPELESVCRDLWYLRVRLFPGLGKNAKDKGKGKGKGKGTDDGVDGGGKASQSSGGSGGTSVAGSDSDAAAGLAMFSSQSAAAEEFLASGNESGVSGGGTKRSRSWAGEIWPLPGAIDTLALVYLGCLLRQEPVRIGDLFRWARNNQIPFLGAVSSRRPVTLTLSVPLLMA
jgi:RNA polymerase I-specific transcription initiation factor RRN7